VLLELPVHKDLQDQKEEQDCRDQLVTVDPRDQQDLQDQLALLVKPVKMDQLEKPEQMVPMV